MTMKGSTRTLVWPVALAIGLVMGLAHTGGVQPAAAATASAPASSQAADPVSVVDAFHAAGDDMEAALALLTDDVVIDLCCPPPPGTPGVWKGKAEARKFFEWRNSNNTRRVREGDAQVTSETEAASNTVLYRVSGNNRVDSDTFRRWGVGAVGHTFQATVQDGKLKYYRGQIIPEEAKRVAAARLLFEQSQAAQPPAGMPRTGGPLILPLLIAVGMVMLTAGAALRRRKV